MIGEDRLLESSGRPFKTDRVRKRDRFIHLDLPHFAVVEAWIRAYGMFAISKSKGNKKLYHAFLVADVEVMQNVEQGDALFCQIFGHTPEEGSREQVNHIRFKEAIANYNKDEESKEYDFLVLTI